MRLGTIVLSVIITIQLTCKAEFDSGGYDLVYNVMVWAFTCEWMLKLLLNSYHCVFTLYGIVTSECQNKICKYMPPLKLTPVNICFRTVSAEAERKKDYVKSIIILTCAIWNWHVDQNVSALSYWMISRLMECWQYVCGILLHKLLEPDLLKSKMVGL